jgi:hypothetical protein
MKVRRFRLVSELPTSPLKSYFLKSLGVSFLKTTAVGLSLLVAVK